MFCILITIGTISIATQDQISYLKASVGNMVTVEKTGSQYFNQDDMNLLIDNNYIKEYNVVSMMSGVLNDAEPYVEDEQRYNTILETLNISNPNVSLPNCSVIGLTNSNCYLLFASSGFNLIKGNHITIDDKDDNIAIISKELAEKNNLQIGDTITISDSSTIMLNSISLTSSLKITGIFEYVGNVSQTPWLPYTEIENFIFI
ncbi:MAG: hypothetical protein FWC47_10385, partial [Oscillospiraceae bacterium]|nr:hypothetical protein [Oscillospiraceae bacterium]